MYFKKLAIYAHKSAMLQTAFKNALKVNPFHVFLHQTKMFKDFKTTWTLIVMKRNFWLMHIFNVTLKIFLGEKISGAVREEIAFNCNRFVVDFYVYNEIIAW
jgi:membrane-associated HD superfamily phosphohydrolase